MGSGSEGDTGTREVKSDSEGETGTTKSEVVVKETHVLWEGDMETAVGRRCSEGDGYYGSGTTGSPVMAFPRLRIK